MNTANPATATTQTDRDARALLADFFRAVERRDLPSFLALFTGDVDLTVVEDSEVYDWPQFRSFAEQFFADVAQIQFELEAYKVNELAPDVAVATGVFTGSGRAVSGDSLRFRTAFTFVLVKRDHGWCISHVHESSLENEIAAEHPLAADGGPGER